MYSYDTIMDPLYISPRTELALELQSRAASSVGGTSPLPWSQHRKQFCRKAYKKMYSSSAPQKEQSDNHIGDKICIKDLNYNYLFNFVGKCSATSESLWTTGVYHNNTRFEIFCRSHKTNIDIGTENEGDNRYYWVFQIIKQSKFCVNKTFLP